MSIALNFACRISWICLTVLASLISVERAGAQCILFQETKLYPNDGDVGDRFGECVVMAGTTVIVGAESDNENGSDAGAAYLVNLTTGMQTMKLTPTDAASRQNFGNSVDVDGATVIIGAIQDRSDYAGAAYLFDMGTGQQLFKLLPDDRRFNQQFGVDVAISGSTALVGAWYDNENGNLAGAAYLFNATNGQQIAKLLPKDVAAGHRFGYSVALQGSLAIVGAQQSDIHGAGAGAVYLFDATNGQQIGTLVSSDIGPVDWFGHSVDISGNTIIVGAAAQNGVVQGGGAAYLFDAITGQQIWKLVPDDISTFDDFGWSVSIDGNFAVVGARCRDELGGTNTGAAYLFDVTTGQQLAKLLADDGAAFDEMGIGVSVEGTTAVVGAWRDDDNGSSSGSVYQFGLSGIDCRVGAEGSKLADGVLAAGQLGDLFDSDDNYYELEPSPTPKSFKTKGAFDPAVHQSGR